MWRVCAANQVSHCFQMYDRSGRTDGCVGMAGVMEAYNATLSGVTLSGPTLFSQVINTAAAMTASNNVSQFNQKYNILMIITDGGRRLLVSLFQLESLKCCFCFRIEHALESGRSMQGLASRHRIECCLRHHRSF